MCDKLLRFSSQLSSTGFNSRHGKTRAICRITDMKNNDNTAKIPTFSSAPVPQASKPINTDSVAISDKSKPLNPLESIFSVVSTWSVRGDRVIIAPPGGLHMEFPSQEYAQAALKAAQKILPSLQHHLATLEAENQRLKLVLADMERIRHR